MDFEPFFYEAQVAISDDLTLHLVLDFEAVDRLERLAEMSIDAIIADMMRSVSTMIKALWSVTRAYHESLTLPQAAKILLPGADGDESKAQAVVATLGDLFRRAFNIKPMEQPKPPAKVRSVKRRRSVG